MAKEAFSTAIKDSDLLYLEKELERDKRPFSLADLAEKLAFLKTAEQREQVVFRYDPACRYEVGDLIYKEYDEPLVTGSKQTEYFQGTVVLKVIKKTYFPDYNCEVLEVDYTGGGPFRKYIDFMKKKNSPVLLPSNTNGAGKTPERIAADEDPRQTTLPITDRDLRAISRNLKQALVKSPKFFSWNDRWQLSANQIEIPEEKVTAIESYLLETKKSASTEELLTCLFQVEPTHPLFELYCLSLNYLLDKKFKKEFLMVSFEGWGKWLLKSVINSWLEGLPVVASPAKLPPLEPVARPQLSLCHAFPFKTYLTWREILSGAIKIPRSLHKELGSSREFLFIDPEEGQALSIYFYPQTSFFLGFKPYFEEHAIPQGASITLEKKGPEKFHFWIKKGKKRITAIKLAYEPATDKIYDRGEEWSTLATPNKILYLERETLTKLFSFYSQRDELDLHGLLTLVFKNFSEGAHAFSLHYLRAYHLVDILKPTTPEDIELILLNSPEFLPSEKGKGVFIYREPLAPAAEVAITPTAATPASTPASLVEETIPGEVEVTAQEAGEMEVIQPSESPVYEPGPAAQVVVPPPKEKPGKKPKLRPEVEKLPRARKSERKVIEERIEIEESEQEALIAIKAKEEAAAEEAGLTPPSAEKPAEEQKAPVLSEKPAFSLFAEKLKSALKKKEGQKK